MNGLLISAIVITVLYTVVKFFQMRFIDKENKPLKELISDSCIVFLVTFANVCYRTIRIDRRIFSCIWVTKRWGFVTG